MAIFKKIEAPFAQISNEFLQNKSISLEAKGLLSYMLSLPIDWDFTIEGIAKNTKTNAHRIVKILTELESFGYHKKEQTFENGKIKDWIYYIYAEPQQEIIDGFIEKIKIKEERKQTKSNKSIDTKEIADTEQDCQFQQCREQHCCSEGDKQTNNLQINSILSKDNIQKEKKKNFSNEHIDKLENGETKPKKEKKKIDINTNTMKPIKKKATPQDIAIIVSYLNEKTNSDYKTTTDKTIELINARVKEGFTVEDFKKVIDRKTKEWLGTQFQVNLVPKTLFGDNFEGYLNAPEVFKRYY